MNAILKLGVLMFATAAMSAAEPVTFHARTAHGGKWSDAQTWEGARQPQAGDFVQVRAGHAVTYDVDSSTALRMLHVAGTLTFSREKNTLLDVGLIKIEPGETTSEDGFNCHDEASNNCWKMSFSATSKALLPVRITRARDVLSKPMAARCFWMKLATCRLKPRPGFCASCSKANTPPLAGAHQ